MGKEKDLKDRLRSLITNWFTLNRKVIYSHTHWLLSVGLSPLITASWRISSKVLPSRATSGHKWTFFFASFGFFSLFNENLGQGGIITKSFLWKQSFSALINIFSFQTKSCSHPARETQAWDGGQGEDLVLWFLLLSIGVVFSWFFSGCFAFVDGCRLSIVHSQP